MGTLFLIAQRHTLLFEVHTLTHAVPLTSEVIAAKLLLQQSIDIALHQCVGRYVLDTFLFEKFGYGAQTNLELSCNLYESQFFLHLLSFFVIFFLFRNFL